MRTGQLASFIAFVLLAIVAVVLYGIFCEVGSRWNTGTGVSTDYVMGVEHSGLFFKTYDVYLRNEHPSSTNTGKYCLPNSLVNSVTDNGHVLARLQGAAENNTVCKLYYHSTLAQWPFECSISSAIIDRVDCESMTPHQ